MTIMSRLIGKTGALSSNIRVLLIPSNTSTVTRNITSSKSLSKTLWSPLQYGKVTCIQPVRAQTDQRSRYSTEPEVQNKSTALSVLNDLKHLGASPAASLLTGLGGLIPFMAVPLYMMAAGYFSPFLAYSQIAYGASILSFVGGIRWGLTIPEGSDVEPSWFNIGYSVTPSLIAWVGLLFPTPLALCTLMTGMGGALYMDLTLYGYPAWFRALRFVLTILAILHLWTTFVLYFVLKSYEEKSAEPPKPIETPSSNMSSTPETKEE